MRSLHCMQAGEALSPFTSPASIVDLSKHHTDGSLLDALALLARLKGAAAAKAAAARGGPAAAPGGGGVSGPSDIAACVRAALGTVVDAPFDQVCGRWLDRKNV